MEVKSDKCRKESILLATIDFGNGVVSDYPFGADGLYIQYKKMNCVCIFGGGKAVIIIIVI